MTHPARNLLWGVPLVLLLLWVFGLLAAAAPGLPDAPWVTRAGLPVVRVLGDFAAVCTVGGVAMGGLILPDRSARVLRWAAYSAAVWGGLLAIEFLLTLSDIAGTAIGAAVQQQGVWPFLSGTDVGQVFLAQALGVVFVGLLAPAVSGAATAWIVLLVAGAAAAAPGLLGHGGLASGHTAMTMSLMAHVAALSVWVGGLIALLAVLKADPGLAPSVVPRFSAVALGCALVVGETGLLNASLRLSQPSQFLTTDYGALLLVKVVLFAALVRLGWRQRSIMLPSLTQEPIQGRRLLVRVAGWELVIMGAAIAASVVLGRMGPPDVIASGSPMTGLAVVTLALAVPLLITTVTDRAGRWVVVQRYPEVTAVVLLVVVAEVGSVGVQSLLGTELGVALGAAALMAAGWLFLIAVRGGGRSPVIIVMVGWPLVAWLSLLLSAPDPVDVRVTILSVVIAELLLVGLAVTGRRVVDIAHSEPVPVAG